MKSKVIPTFWRALVVVVLLLLAMPSWAQGGSGFCDALLAPVESQTSDQNYIRIIRLYSNVSSPSDTIEILRRITQSDVAINPFSVHANRIEIQFEHAIAPLVANLDRATWKTIIEQAETILKEKTGHQTDRAEKANDTAAMPVTPTIEAKVSLDGSKSSRPSVLTLANGRNLIAIGVRIPNGMVASEPHFEIYEFKQNSSEIELLVKSKIEESGPNTTAYSVYTTLLEKNGKLFLITSTGFEIKAFEVNLNNKTSRETGRISVENRSEHPITFAETDDGKLVTSVFTDEGQTLDLKLIELSFDDGHLNVIKTLKFENSFKSRVRLSPSHRLPVYNSPDVLKLKDGSVLIATAVEHGPFRFFKYSDSQLTEILKNNIEAANSYPMNVHETKKGRSFLAVASSLRKMSIYEIKNNTIELFGEHQTCMATHGPATFYEKEDGRVFVHYMACDDLNLIELDFKNRKLVERMKINSASQSSDKRGLLVPLNKDFFFFLSTNDQSGLIYRYEWSKTGQFQSLSKERFSDKFTPSFNTILRTVDGNIYIVTVTNSSWLIVSKIARIMTVGAP